MRKRTEVPLYQKLMDDIKKAIDNGHYKKGDLLPSENDLCATYKTTRPTVRQALSNLMILGYINRHHGKGSIVAEPKKGLGILSVSSVTAGIGHSNLKTKVLQKPQKLDWPSDFYFPLNESEESLGAIYFSRIKYINNAPILYEETFITNNGIEAFTKQNLQNRSFFKTLNEVYNIEIKEGQQKIWAITAPKQLSSLLDVSHRSPILHLKRKLQTNIANTCIYSFLYCTTKEYFLEDFF